MMRLLVAHEDSDAADLLADALRMHGYAVRTAYSEKQCLKLLGEFRPNLVLLFLPAVGFGRQLRREVPVIDGGEVKKPVDLLLLRRMIRESDSRVIYLRPLIIPDRLHLFVCWKPIHKPLRRVAHKKACRGWGRTRNGPVALQRRHRC